MKFISTRGKAPALSFDEVLLTGLASDGGLYVPEEWPVLTDDMLKSFKDMPYDQVAFKVMRLFCGDVISDDDLLPIIEKAYSTFDSESPAPLRDIGNNLWLMELFHGPTLAFKDVAMQFLGGMFDHVLARKKSRVTIVGATSGDTGSAAIEAVKGKDAIDIFMLHPKGRVSEVQRRQMSTALDHNVHNIALEGTFDDCQDMVKAMFGDTPFRERHHLSAVNSINWARIMAQIVYYITTAAKLGAPDKPVSFCVPTGNFGNVFAGYAAKRMGVPIKQLLVASNSNDILTRFFDTGTMKMTGVEATTSPSMDIQISSNFERLLFELTGRDGDRVSQLMDRFRETGQYSVTEGELFEALDLFKGARYDDDQVKAEIKHYHGVHHNEAANLIDPHTAVAMAAAREHRSDTSIPMIVLSTAHPAKFGDTVKSATGINPKLPERLSDLLEREEQYEVLPNDLNAVENYIDSITAKSGNSV